LDPNIQYKYEIVQKTRGTTRHQQNVIKVLQKERVVLADVIVAAFNQLRGKRNLKNVDDCQRSAT